MTPSPFLVSALELRDLLDTDASVRVLDVRWRFDRPDGREAFASGHVPGAVYVDLPTDLAATGAPATAGRFPLPPRDRLQEAARRWGLRQDEIVVVYDDIINSSSARAWWVLRDAGVADVRVLDGALNAWIDAGLPLERGEVVPDRGDVILAAHHMLPLIDTAGARAFSEQGVLLDARPVASYQGVGVGVDARAGHIPGAVSAPTMGSLGDGGRFLPPELIRERFIALGVDPDLPVAVYCGAGVTAAHASVALAIAGFDPILYPGSWSAWAAHPDLPAALGDTPR